jgi:hypothetical protein
MLPHVDEFRAAHNLKSFEDLAEALARPAVDAAEDMRQWRRRAA